MSNTHHIVLREPVWVIRGLTLKDDPDFGGQSLLGDVGEPEIDDAVYGFEEGDMDYECTCGAELDTHKEAEEHLKEIRDSENGEAVTSPDN